MKMGSAVRHILAAVALAATSSVVLAQSSWPTKTIKIVVGIPPGLAADVFARFYADKLSSALGQPVVVENKLGAAGNIAQESVARATPDGYTLLYAVSNSFVANPYLYKKLPFDADKDFTPVSTTVLSGLYLVVNKDFPAKNVADLIKLVRANPGKYSFASYGVGGYPHLMVELLRDQEKLDMVHVPYRGGVLPDLVGGVVPMVMEPPNSAIPYIKDGRIKALAFLGDKRHPATPDVPLLTETVKGAELNSFHGIWAPAGTPKEIVARLNQEIAKASRDRELQEKIRAAYAETTSSSPDEMSAMVKREQLRWRELIKSKNIQVE